MNWSADHQPCCLVFCCFLFVLVRFVLFLFSLSAFLLLHGDSTMDYVSIDPISSLLIAHGRQDWSCYRSNSLNLQKCNILYFRFVKRPGESHLALDGKKGKKAGLLAVGTLQTKGTRLVASQALRTQKSGSEDLVDPSALIIPLRAAPPPKQKTIWVLRRRLCQTRKASKMGKISSSYIGCLLSCSNSAVRLSGNFKPKHSITRPAGFTSTAEG